jgi:hypothetical protein
LTLEKSSKIIPILSPLLIDEEKSVRELSFQCLKLFLNELEKFAFSVLLFFKILGRI